MASTEVEDEQMLEQLWKDAQDRFSNKTGKKLKPPLRFEEMIATLEKKFNPKDPEDGRTQQKIKTIGKNLLNFVQLMGGLVAQGASVVFGPANMCFNAIQVLINVPSKISKYHADIARLFEEISLSMKQFQIYRRIDKLTNIGSELRGTTHNVLIALVDICAICTYQVCNDKPLYRLGRMAKLVLCDDDSGVQDALDKFKKLIGHQKAIQDAVTLERVIQSQNDASHEFNNLYDKLNRSAEESMDKLQRMEGKIDDVKTDTGILVQAYKQTNDQTQWQKCIEKVRVKLNIPKGNGKETEREKASQQIASNRKENAGRWLPEISEYNNWINIESTTNRVLYLSGENGCGKSTLISTIFDSLVDRYQLADDVSKAVYVAFSSFTNDDKMTGDKSSPVIALKSIAIQLAEQSDIYAQRLDLSLKDKDIVKDTNAVKLSKSLLPPQDMKRDDKYFFLLIDGLDKLKENEAKDLFDAVLNIKEPNFKVVMSGTNEIWKTCSEASSKSFNLISIIDILERNKSDLKLCIESNLKSYPALQAVDDNAKELVDAIRKKLPVIANGSFKNVRDIIDKVNDAWISEKEFDKVKSLISEKGLRNVDLEVERTIENLNQSLSAPEILQLNEILIWTIYAPEPISVQEMQAILILAGKTSRQNVKDKVLTKYAKVVQICPDKFEDLECFDVRKQEISDYFKGEDRPRQGENNQSTSESHISMTIQLNNVPISKAKRFFWDLSEKGLFTGFSFTDSALRIEPSSIISANRTDAELSIVRLCFKALDREADERTKIIDRYTTQNLTVHLSRLKECVQNEESPKSKKNPPEINIQHNFLESSERREIIEKLVSLLKSPECIERHLSEDFFYLEHFLDETNGIPVLEQWLKDSQVNNLPYQTKMWIQGILSGNLALALEGIAKMVAENWLCKRVWRPKLPYMWIDVYLDRLHHYSVHNQHSTDSQAADDTGIKESEQKMPDRERIQRAVDWAEKEVKINTKDALWFERLGMTYSSFEEHTLAKEQLLKAKEYPRCSWQALMALAESYAALKDLEAAVEEMKAVLTQLQAVENQTEEESDSVVQALIQIAQWQAKLEMPEEAVRNLREVINIETSSYRGYYELLDLYVDMRKESEAIKLLEELNEQRSKSDDLTMLGSMMLYFSNEYNAVDCFETLFRATRHKNIFQIVLKTLEESLEFSRERNKTGKITSTELNLRVCHGMAIAQHTVDYDRHEKAFGIWKECIKLGFDSSGWDTWYSTFHAARLVLSHYYLHEPLFNDGANGIDDHVAELNRLIERANNFPWYAKSVRLMMSALYRKAGAQERAEKLVISDMKTGLELLFDDTPKNDHFGYAEISQVLLHTGDFLNAISAWSLYGPMERREEVKKDPEALTYGSTNAQELTAVAEQDDSIGLYHYCDGTCNRKWTWSDRVWVCKICNGFMFCDECLDGLQNRTLKRVVCNPAHEWLHMPSWREEYEATNRHSVRIGGELKPPCGQRQDGKRMGGEIVPIDRWLKSIKEGWDAKEKAVDDKPRDNRSDSATADFKQVNGVTA